jgi:hypothetical protein
MPTNSNHYTTKMCSLHFPPLPLLPLTSIILTSHPALALSRIAPAPAKPQSQSHTSSTSTQAFSPPIHSSTTSVRAKMSQEEALTGLGAWTDGCANIIFTFEELEREMRSVGLLDGAMHVQAVLYRTTRIKILCMEGNQWNQGE